MNRRSLLRIFAGAVAAPVVTKAAPELVANVGLALPPTSAAFRTVGYPWIVDYDIARCISGPLGSGMTSSALPRTVFRAVNRERAHG